MDRFGLWKPGMIITLFHSPVLLKAGPGFRSG